MREYKKRAFHFKEAMRVWNPGLGLKFALIIHHWVRHPFPAETCGLRLGQYRIFLHSSFSYGKIYYIYIQQSQLTDGLLQ